MTLRPAHGIKVVLADRRVSDVREGAGIPLAPTGRGCPKGG